MISYLTYDEILSMMKLSTSIIDEELREQIISGIEIFQDALDYHTANVIIDIDKTNLMDYPTCREYLNNSSKVIIGVDTIGEKVSYLIHSEGENGNYILSMIYDFIANYYIAEYHCKQIKETRAKMELENKYLSHEIVPGNNEDIVMQKEIFKHLSTEYVKLTDSYLMLPAKSLSYVFGITNLKDNSEIMHNCSECMSRNCMYRKK